jgi:hypothetical protein
MSEAKERIAALQAFKDYVHKRLDDAGVPVDPESPHKAAGCRIGGRLDEVFKRITELERCLNDIVTEVSYLNRYRDDQRHPTLAKALKEARTLLQREIVK